MINDTHATERAIENFYSNEHNIDLAINYAQVDDAIDIAASETVREALLECQDVIHSEIVYEWDCMRDFFPRVYSDVDLARLLDKARAELRISK
jgi:hypothetical protein